MALFISVPPTLIAADFLTLTAAIVDFEAHQTADHAILILELLHKNFHNFYETYQPHHPYFTFHKVILNYILDFVIRHLSDQKIFGLQRYELVERNRIFSSLAKKVRDFERKRVIFEYHIIVKSTGVPERHIRDYIEFINSKKSLDGESFKCHWEKEQSDYLQEIFQQEKIIRESSDKLHLEFERKEKIIQKIILNQRPPYFQNLIQGKNYLNKPQGSPIYPINFMLVNPAYETQKPLFIRKCYSYDLEERTDPEIVIIGHNICPPVFNISFVRWGQLSSTQEFFAYMAK